MKLWKKTAYRLLLAASVAIVAVGLIAPRLDADRFGERVKASLREALGREVEIGKVRLDLFNGPGFSVEKVIIYDEPAAGLEPARLRRFARSAGQLREFLDRAAGVLQSPAERRGDHAGAA